MTEEKAIKELRDSYELHQCEWAKRCLDTIQESVEKKDKTILEMAEWIYENIDLCKMSKMGMEIDYDIEKFIIGISDEEAKKIIIEYFEKKEG